MATSYSGIQPLYKTGEQMGGEPTVGRGAYGLVPNLPLYTTDTAQTIGTDIFPQLVEKLPGYLPMVEQSSQNIQSWLQGRLAPDVMAQIYQGGAERGAGIGSPGSANAYAATLRALGLTSQQMQQAGESALTAAIQRTPIQANQIATTTTDLAAQRAQYAAAPDPAAAAAAELAAARRGVRMGAGSIAAPSLGGGGGGVSRGISTTTGDPLAGAYSWQNLWNAGQDRRFADATTPTTGTFPMGGFGGYAGPSYAPELDESFWEDYLGILPEGTTYEESTGQYVPEWGYAGGAGEFSDMWESGYDPLSGLSYGEMEDLYY